MNSKTQQIKPSLNLKLEVEQLPQQFPTAKETVHYPNGKVRFHRGQLLSNIAHGNPAKDKASQFKKRTDEKLQLKQIKKEWNKTLLQVKKVVLKANSGL